MKIKVAANYFFVCLLDGTDAFHQPTFVVIEKQVRTDRTPGMCDNTRAQSVVSYKVCCWDIWRISIVNKIGKTGQGQASKTGAPVLSFLSVVVLFPLTYFSSISSAEFTRPGQLPSQTICIWLMQCVFVFCLVRFFCTTLCIDDTPKLTVFATPCCSFAALC